MTSGSAAMARSQGDPFLHAARKFRRMKIADFGAQADLGQLGGDNLPGLGAVHSFFGEQAEGHVLPHRQGVEQRRALEQHAELAINALARLGAGAHHFFVIDMDAARVRVEQTQDALEHDRFSDSRAANHDHRFADPDVKVEAIQNDFGSEGLVDAPERDLGRVFGHWAKNISVRM